MAIKLLVFMLVIDGCNGYLPWIQLSDQNSVKLSATIPCSESNNTDCVIRDVSQYCEEQPNSKQKINIKDGDAIHIQWGGSSEDYCVTIAVINSSNNTIPLRKFIPFSEYGADVFYDMSDGREVSLIWMVQNCTEMNLLSSIYTVCSSVMSDKQVDDSRTTETKRTIYLGALVGLLSVITATRPLVASRLVFLSLECNFMKQYGLPFILHPINPVIGIDECIAVIAGTAIIMLAFLIPYGIAIGIQRSWSHIDLLATIRYPSIPILVWELLFQGTVVASFTLIHENTNIGLTIAGVSVIVLCLFFIISLHKYLKKVVLVDRHIEYKHYDRSAFEKVFSGESSWVSRHNNHNILESSPSSSTVLKPDYLKRFSGVIGRYTRHSFNWPAVELLISLVLAAVPATGKSSRYDCGVMKAVSASLFTLFTLCEILIRPNINKQSNITYAVVNVLQCVGLSCASAGYFQNLDSDDVVVKGGRMAFLIAIIILFFKCFIDVSIRCYFGRLEIQRLAFSRRSSSQNLSLNRNVHQAMMSNDEASTGMAQNDYCAFMTPQSADLSLERIPSSHCLRDTPREAALGSDSQHKKSGSLLLGPRQLNCNPLSSQKEVPSDSELIELSIEGPLLSEYVPPVSKSPDNSLLRPSSFNLGGKPQLTTQLHLSGSHQHNPCLQSSLSQTFSCISDAVDESSPSLALVRPSSLNLINSLGNRRASVTFCQSPLAQDKPLSIRRLPRVARSGTVIKLPPVSGLTFD